MTRIPRNIGPRVFKPNKIKFQKSNSAFENTIRKGENLEKFSMGDYLDFSTEEFGYFTRRDVKTNKVLEVINMIFPR